jgi:hypothetical protein
MALDIKSIFGMATDLLPGGTLVKSIVRGAGALLLKKAGEKVGVKEDKIESILNQAQKLAEEDEDVKKALLQEEEARRQFELSFFGKAGELSPKAQLWRAITRPILSLGLVGLLVLGIIIQYLQQIFGVPKAELLVIPGQVVELAKWVVAFWFTSRGVEKVVGLFK